MIEERLTREEIERIKNAWTWMLGDRKAPVGTAILGINTPRFVEKTENGVVKRLYDMMFDGVSIKQNSKKEAYFTFNCFRGLYYQDVKKIAHLREYDFILLESDPAARHKDDAKIILESAILYQRLCYQKNTLDDSWLFNPALINDLKKFSYKKSKPDSNKSKHRK